VIYLVYLYSRHPQRVTEVGLVHLDTEPGEQPVLATGEEEQPRP
jgi:hypothetical protein